MRSDETKQKSSPRCLICSVFIALALGCGAGILIGRYAICSDEKTETPPKGLYLQGVPDNLMMDEDQSIIDELINNVNNENIRQNLQ